MAAVCAECGANLGFGRRLSGKDLCESCENKAEAAAAAAAATRETALATYRSYAATVTSDGADGVTRLQAIAQQAGLLAGEVLQANLDAYHFLLANAIQDEYLSEDEEANIDRTSTLLQLPVDERRAVVRSFGNLVLIARMNAGRLNAIENVSIMLKPSEQAFEVPATLLKETVHRQTQGAYGGVSFRVAKGVRFNTGRYRGHSVVTGTTLDEADTGVLCITSQRAVFKGLRQAIESQFAKRRPRSRDAARLRRRSEPRAHRQA